MAKIKRTNFLKPVERSTRDAHVQYENTNIYFVVMVNDFF